MEEIKYIFNPEEKEKLYIPQGLNTNKEFLKGLETKSIFLAFTIIAFINIPNLILSIFFIRQILFFITYMTISSIFAFLLVIKENNLSILDILMFFFKYLKTQKKYEYIAKDEWS